MAEHGCLKDGHFHNLSCEGKLVMHGNDMDHMESAIYIEGNADIGGTQDYPNFTIDASTGNTVTQGTLMVHNTTTLLNPLLIKANLEGAAKFEVDNTSGDVKVNNNKFKVTGGDGSINVGPGNFKVDGATGKTDITGGDLVIYKVEGDVHPKFSVEADSGDTRIAGTLSGGAPKVVNLSNTGTHHLQESMDAGNLLHVGSTADATGVIYTIPNPSSTSIEYKFLYI